MRGRICEWQETMLDTTNNIHISRCICAECEYGFDSIIEERCKKCKHLSPIIGEDQMALSMAVDIDVAVDERADEEITAIIERHCKKCPQYIADTDVCKSATCSCHSVVREASRSLRAHCPNGVW